MTVTTNQIEISELKNNFNILLKNLETALDGKLRTNIYNTKMGQYKKKLNNLNESDDEFINLIPIINKYLSLNHLFSETSKIEYNKDDLRKIIEGQCSTNDSNDKYNDTFFEISMAIRFSLASKEPVSINLKDICDVVINKTIAIECKYVHSGKRLRDNIKKAIKQINTRVDNKEAKVGIVALDLSHIYEDEKIQKFIEYVFSLFLNNYKKINDDEKLLESILINNHFKSIIMTYVTHELEISLYKNISKNILEQMMNNKIVAIMYQMNYSHFFEYNEEVISVPFRAMTYIINPKLMEEKKINVKKILHSLQTGI